MILQRELRDLLINNGFKIEDRKYKPHITIGREIVKKNSTDEDIYPPLHIPIYSMAIMESKRVNNELVYKPVEEKILVV